METVLLKGNVVLLTIHIYLTPDHIDSALNYSCYFTIFLSIPDLSHKLIKRQLQSPKNTYAFHQFCVKKPDRSSNLCIREGPCVRSSWPGYRGVQGPKGGDGGDAGKPGKERKATFVKKLILEL